jgi:hypothetical protein
LPTETRENVHGGHSLRRLDAATKIAKGKPIMITENATRQNVYEHILKAANRRLEQAIPGSEGAFANLSLGAVVNLLFLLKGEWGSIGDFITTQRALRASVGDDLLWADPQNSPPVPVGLIQ